MLPSAVPKVIGAGDAQLMTGVAGRIVRVPVAGAASYFALSSVATT